MVVTGLLLACLQPRADAAPVNRSQVPRTISPANLGVPGDIVFGTLDSMLNPNQNPEGTNDYSCKPSTAHPNPVVLVHGTFGNAYSNWSGLAQVLKQYGYCVYAPNYGAWNESFIKGTGDMIASAAYVGWFVDDLRLRTGASRVDLVGYSQGGSVARYYANLSGGAAKVDKVIGIVPSNHKTDLSGLVSIFQQLGLAGPLFALTGFIGMPAVEQQASDSQFFANMNGAGETRPGISYTNIASVYDEVVTPYTQAFISQGQWASVDNITLQNICPEDLSDHLGIIFDSNVYQIVLNALDPMDRRPIDCKPALPIFGT